MSKPPKAQNISKGEPTRVTASKLNSSRMQTAAISALPALQRAYANPQRLTPADARILQRTIGNRAMGRLAIQGKMMVGPAGDTYEQEADAVAKHVVDAIHAPPTQTAPAESAQRQEEEEVAQMKPLVQRQEEEELAQMKPQPQSNSAGGFDTEDSFESKLNSQRGGGSPLPADLRANLEPKFGSDFSGVRVHTNTESHRLNQAIQAKAFTTGQDVFFRQGAFQPGSRDGQELIAHELTHVVQQQGPVVRRPVIQREFGFSEKQMSAFSKKQQEERTAELAAVSGGIQDRQKHGFRNERQQGEAAQNFKDMLDGSLAGLANALFRAPVGIAALSDNDLVRILQTTFESDWFKAKKCLTTDYWPGVTGTRPPHGASIQLMQALVNMRGRVWDRFVGQVQSKIKDEVSAQRAKGGEFANLQNPNKFNDNFGLKESVGSESVTSDIDLSAKGENTEIGVRMINAEFRARFGTEPGTFFDINVYSSDWMFKPTEVIEDRVVKKTPTSEAKASTDQELSAANQKRKDDRNEVWSMVKIRRNMSADDWDTYKAQLLFSLSSPSPANSSPQQAKEESAKRADMIKKFADVDREWETYQKTVSRKIAELKEAINYEENRQKSAFEDRLGEDEFAEEAMEMAVRNREYEKQILLVKELRLQIRRLSEANEQGSRAQVEALLLQVHDGVARGLTYANEVYATEGAVLHTVFGSQGAQKELKERKAKKENITDVKYLLTKEQYLQSLNENVGDTLHSLEHNKHDPQYAVYRAGKYIARLCDAAVQLLTKEVAETIPGYLSLLEIGDASVKEKQGAAGQDPLAVRETGTSISPESFFSRFEAGDMSLVKSWTMGLGAKAAAIYKQSKP